MNTPRAVWSQVAEQSDRILDVAEEAACLRAVAHTRWSNVKDSWSRS